MTEPGSMGPRVGGLGALVAFTALALFLDGLAGASAGVIVAAVLLARLPLRTIGGIGVACLVAAPIVVAAQGVPTPADLTPAFVARSLWPHHLTFVGLALVGAWVVADVVGAAWRGGDEAAVAAEATEEGPEPAVVGAALWLRVGMVAVVALGAAAASVAVLLR
jgi:hypothetical protein